MRQSFSSSNYTRQTCRTLISVCQSSGCYVIPAGWTFREGPGQIIPSWCFQTEPGRPLCHGLKAVQPALWARVANQASVSKTTQAILALGGFQPLIRPSATPEHMSGRYSMDPQVESSLCCWICNWQFCFFVSFSNSLCCMLWLWMKDVSLLACDLWFTCGDCSESLWPFSSQIDAQHTLQHFTFHLVVRKPLLCQDFSLLVLTDFFWRNSHLAHSSDLQCRVNSDQKLGQEIPEVEIDAEDEDLEIEIVELIVIERTLVPMRHNHHFRSSHDQNLLTVDPLFDWLQILNIDLAVKTAVHQEHMNKIWPLGTTSMLRLYVVESLYKWSPSIPHQWLWPFIPTGACNSTSTVLHHGKNKTSSTDFFNPSILQDQHQSQQTHLSTSNISNHSVKFYLLQIIAPHQLPEAVVPLSLPPHHEKVENDELCPFPFQTFFVLVSTRPPKAVQKLNIVVIQIRAYQLALALNGLTNLNNRTMDIAGLL